MIHVLGEIRSLGGL